MLIPQAALTWNEQGRENLTTHFFTSAPQGSKRSVAVHFHFPSFVFLLNAEELYHLCALVFVPCFQVKASNDLRPRSEVLF